MILFFTYAYFMRVLFTDDVNVKTGQLSNLCHIG